MPVVRADHLLDDDVEAFRIRAGQAGRERAGADGSVSAMKGGNIFTSAKDGNRGEGRPQSRPERKGDLRYLR